MKKLLVLLGIIFIFGTPVLAEDTANSDLLTNDVILFTQNERWGLKDKADNITVEPIFAVNRTIYNCLNFGISSVIRNIIDGHFGIPLFFSLLMYLL